MTDVLKSRVGYDKHPQQWKDGFDLACREMQVRVEQSNAYIQELLDRHKQDIIDLKAHEHQKTLVMRKQLEYLMECNYIGVCGQLSPAPIIIDRSDDLELNSMLNVGEFEMKPIVGGEYYQPNLSGVECSIDVSVDGVETTYSNRIFGEFREWEGDGACFNVTSINHTPMYLYKLDRNRKDDRYYNGYSGTIVSAPTEQEARLIHPSGDMRYAWMDGKWMFKTFDGEYVIADGYWRNPDELKVECIGTTHLPKGVVLASFNRV